MPQGRVMEMPNPKTDAMGENDSSVHRGLQMIHQDSPSRPQGRGMAYSE